MASKLSIQYLGPKLQNSFKGLLQNVSYITTICWIFKVNSFSAEKGEICYYYKPLTKTLKEKKT
jgi:hypothetical protein